MSETWSIFDVIGPVMIGPSSSHTAGACFIGLMARQIFGEEPKEVKIKLHGSYGEVYKGHGTDIAILAGLLNIQPHESILAQSMEIAKKKKIKFEFESCNLGSNLHPNTALIKMIAKDKKMYVQGESIGGGKCKITEIDKAIVSIGPEMSCLLVKYDNKNNILTDIINIVTKRNFHINQIDTPVYKDVTLAVIMVREHFENDILNDIKKLPGVIFTSYINHISHYNQNYD
ncbi:L-serine dehydratase, iron-sulfur-dependent subunit beta [Candidatus Peregrinibacteria bacterium RIFOXYB2_FULL_32_7]|nr:MAG: L-serine dehydratase, iron-sulfur-dependent subunit beta [Candidatus Peregrinibacteria bacterium RIFOXYB2_FULL_32_7]